MLDRRPILVLGGPFRWTETLAHLARKAPLVLAADGGANTLARIGVRPDVVIGDLDSIDAGTRSWIGEERMVHRPDQGTTDFEKALVFAFEDSNLDRLIVLGALGGRLDHAIGNLGILAREAHGPGLIFLSDKEQVLATALEVNLDATSGETWSFWTFDPGVRVTLEGVRWPVENAPLTAGDHPSISNEATSTSIHLTPTGGSVIACRLLPGISKTHEGSLP